MYPAVAAFGRCVSVLIPAAAFIIVIIFTITVYFIIVVCITIAVGFIAGVSFIIAVSTITMLIHAVIYKKSCLFLQMIILFDEEVFFLLCPVQKEHKLMSAAKMLPVYIFKHGCWLSRKILLPECPSDDNQLLVAFLYLRKHSAPYLVGPKRRIFVKLHIIYCNRRLYKCGIPASAALRMPHKYKNLFILKALRLYALVRFLRYVNPALIRRCANLPDVVRHNIYHASLLFRSA